MKKFVTGGVVRNVLGDLAGRCARRCEFLPTRRDLGVDLEVLRRGQGFRRLGQMAPDRNNSDGRMKDEELIAFTDGAYRTGLDYLKTMLEPS